MTVDGHMYAGYQNSVKRKFDIRHMPGYNKKDQM